MALITRFAAAQMDGVNCNDGFLTICMPDVALCALDASMQMKDKFVRELSWTLAADEHMRVATIFQHGMISQMVYHDGEVLDLDTCDYSQGGVLDLAWVRRQCNVLICDPWALVRGPSLMDGGEVAIKYIEEQAEVANLHVICIEPFRRLRLEDLKASNIELEHVA